MAAKKYTKDDCVMLLRSKQESLAANGEERLPQRSDFAEDEVVAIKAFLGPWPRALEAAGQSRQTRGFVGTARRNHRRNP